MKVDFIIGTLGKGGAERVMVILSNFFVQKNYTVRLITFDNNPDAYELDSEIERIRIIPKKFKTKKLDNLFGLNSFYRTAEQRPKVVISFLTFTNLIAILVCKFRKIPIIVSEHNNHTFMLQPKWLVKFTWQYVYRRANFVTVLTDFDIDFFQRKKANVVVMPNPCSFPALPSNHHEREKSLLAIGSLDRIHHKGFDNLIEIMSQVLSKNPNWELKIVGGGSESNFEKIKNLVVDKKLEKQISLLGYRNDINELMQKGSIYILPSRFEGLPMVLLEAMSQGMACVAYDCITGPSNMITNNLNGILVKDQDKNEMTNAINNLIQDEETRRLLGSKAIKSLDRYKTENIYFEWKKLIDKIN